MGLFNHDKGLENQYKKVTESSLKDLNEEFLAGFKYGKEEYAGSWESKNWKDDLTIFQKALEQYDRIKFIADAKSLGIHLGRLDAMLKSGLSYDLLNDDKGSKILQNIIEKITAMKTFNITSIKKDISKIKSKKLSIDGQQNQKRILLTMK